MAARWGTCEECGAYGVSLRECHEDGGYRMLCVPCMNEWLQS